MVEDKAVLTVADQYEVIYYISIGAIFNDLTHIFGVFVVSFHMSIFIGIVRNIFHHVNWGLFHRIAIDSYQQESDQ